MAEQERTLPLSNRLPPPKSTHHGCVILLMSVRSPLLPLLRSVSDCLSDTCSDSASLSAYSLSRRWVLVPPATFPTHLSLHFTSSPVGSLWQAGMQRRRASCQDPPPPNAAGPRCNTSSCCSPGHRCFIRQIAQTDSTSFSMNVSVSLSNISALVHAYCHVIGRRQTESVTMKPQRNAVVITGSFRRTCTQSCFVSLKEEHCGS